jgi:outer membrane protein OmpA-like peptidoglycan-associated protein
LYSERTDQSKSFTSDLWDAGLNLTLNINEIFAEYNEKRLFNFYLFSGAGLASFKSEIHDLITDAVIEEHSERQNEFFVPVGGGALIRLNHTFSVNLEYGDRIIFNDEALDFKEAGKPHDHYGYASAGLFIRFGAKDTDKDGLKDKKDLCPEVPGKIELDGCPDKDNDGIADKDDACPDAAGKPEFKGCPDTDGDGIPDKDDSCPMVAGKKELKGCPDRDGDGVIDGDDLWPDVFGLAIFAGVPDTDGDGIPDNNDACPDVKGLPAFKGCPDVDGDGIPDKEDKCPDIAGVAANFGCPEVKTVELSKVVYFNFDKAVVSSKYLSDIDELAILLLSNDNVKVIVEGHADATGPESYNMKLSEKRAEFVINYLVKKGINKDQLVKAFFGEQKPISDNNSAEGRAKNRRVEINTGK